MSTRLWTCLALLLFVVAWAVLPDFSISLLASIGLYAMVALGLVLLTGIGGMTSFGQAAFVGLGAYSTAWLCTTPLVPALLGLPAGSAWLPWVGLLLGLGLTALVALVLGAITLRLSGHYLPLCTLAWGLSLYFLFGNMSFLGGHTGLGGIPSIRLGGWSLQSPRELGVLIWGSLLLLVWAAHNLLDSRGGRALRALKGGRVMAESMGVRTHQTRIKVFVLAALLAALSGWLYAHLQRFVNPSPFHINIGIEYLFMAVLGGSGYLWGAVLGATLMTLMKHYLQDWLPYVFGASGNFESIVFGLLMIVVLQRFADGLWPRIAHWCKPLLRQPVVRAASGAAAMVLPVRSLQAPGEQVLQARQISRQFGGLVANKEVDFEVRAGEIHALIGPNGAGKSTFFNLISGLDQPSAGEVTLAGYPMTGQPARRYAERGLARTFQHVRLLGQRSVLDNVALGAHLRGHRGWLAAMLCLDRGEEAALLAEAQRQLERCGLAEQAQTPAGALPLGQQRIVEIARALAANPGILLLDEPAAGLRHLEKKALAALLTQLRGEGLALVVVEHDMEFVMNVADRVTVLEFGQVIAHGSPQQVQQDPRVRAAYLGSADDEEDAPPVGAAPRVAVGGLA